jgi:hypothetical protein
VFLDVVFGDAPTFASAFDGRELDTVLVRHPACGGGRSHIICGLCRCWRGSGRRRRRTRRRSWRRRRRGGGSGCASARTVAGRVHDGEQFSDFHVLTGLPIDPREHTGLVGADLAIYLVGLELDACFAGRDRVAYFLQPAPHARFDDRFTKLRDDDVGGHIRQSKKVH